MTSPRPASLPAPRIPAHRRHGPRIGATALCWELIDGRERDALAVDLSRMGLCIERPYVGGPTPQAVPLELEVPGIDEVMWARGEACFDVIVPRRGPAGGALGLVRRTGYRIAAAAQRDLRRLAEVVMETHRAEARAARARSAAPLPADAFDLSDLSGGASADRAGALALASCYARG